MAGHGETYVHLTRSGGFYSVLALFAVFPLMALCALLPNEVSQTVRVVGLPTLLLVALLFYLFYRTEVTLTLAPDVVRLTEQDVAFGARRALRVVWELPRAELTDVREVTTRTPSSRGGWDRSTTLHFPGDRTMHESALGTKAAAASQYNRLVGSLRASLGDRFVVEEKV